MNWPYVSKKQALLTMSRNVPTKQFYCVLDTAAQIRASQAVYDTLGEQLLNELHDRPKSLSDDLVKGVLRHMIFFSTAVANQFRMLFITKGNARAALEAGRKQENNLSEAEISMLIGCMISNDRMDDDSVQALADHLKWRYLRESEMVNRCQQVLEKLLGREVTIEQTSIGL